VPEYRVMSFSEGERVRWVEHIACMWKRLEMCAIIQSEYLIGRPVLVELEHTLDYSRTVLDLKGKGC